MWPLCSQLAGACLGCDKGAPCPSWGTASISTVRLAVTRGGHVPHGRCQMLHPPECPGLVPSVPLHGGGPDQTLGRGLLLRCRAGTQLGTAVLAGATPSLCTGHPPLLLRQGGGSTSEGTAQRCPLLPLPEHPHTRPGPQGLCSAPRCQAEPAVRGVSAGALGPQEGRFALRQRSGAEDCASHRPLPPSLLVAVTVSVQRGNLGTETDPAAPHPSPALV